MKIGDKLICDNGKIYTLGEGNKAFDIAIIDENGLGVNAYHSECLIDCYPDCQGVQKLLNVGIDEDWSKSICVKVIKVEEC